MTQSGKAAVVCAVILLGVTASAPVLAHHHRSRVHFGFHVGVPLGAPWWYYPPPYYYYYRPPVVVVPAAPPTYIERGDAQAPAQSQNYWYYCADSKTYYPYVKECPGGWQQVLPQPSAGQ